MLGQRRETKHPTINRRNKIMLNDFQKEQRKEIAKLFSCHPNDLCGTFKDNLFDIEHHGGYTINWEDWSDEELLSEIN
jgi:hypothetical protein